MTFVSDYLSRGTAAVALVMLSCCAPRPERVAPRQHRPAWAKQGIVMAGNWEPLAHSIRAGLATVREVETWHAERTEDVARKLQDLGVNLVITNFYKGFGLETEREYIDATRRFVQAAHRHGIRVGGYVGGTMYAETLFAEMPEARDWQQVNEYGEPVYYNDGQTHRIAYCRNNPGLQAFMQKVLRLGIRDVGLDLIHFDQMGWWMEPQSCRCRYCREDFRNFLRRRYTSEKAKLRFGFPGLEWIAPPLYRARGGQIALEDLRNPLMQEWALWRAESQARIFGEYDAYIGSLNPEVAMDGNPFFSVDWNYGFVGGTDLGQYLQHGDFMWSEEASHASWTEDERLVSRIRTFKAVRGMGRSVFMYTGGKWGTQDADSPPALRMAEAMAYNGANIGMVGNVTPEGTVLKPGALEYIRFFRAHMQDLAGSTPVADAAVLRSFASTEFNPGKVIPSTMLFEQTLIQNRVPFDIIFDRQLGRLARYKVLVLANQDALSDEQMKAVRAFVSNGGGLVATEDTSMYNERRWRREEFGLADVFGVRTRGTDEVRREFGKGRVVYIPAIEPAVKPPRAQMTYSFPDRYWALPKNAEQLAGAVRWAARGGLSAEIDAPPSVTAEVARAGTGRMFVHLVNYNFTKPVSGVNVRVRVPSAPREVAVETPDAQRQVLKAEVKDGVAAFRVPQLKTYQMIVLQF